MAFGLPMLTNTYFALVAYDGDLKRLKKAVVHMIIMFCEAVRFELLFQEILKMMGAGSTLPLPPVMCYWTNNWKVLSGFALNCKQRDETLEMAGDPELLLKVRKFEVNNRDDIAKLTGLIMCKQP